MPEEKQRKIALPRGGVFGDLTQRIKLIMRLVGDERVSPLIKLLPLGSLIYLIFPDIAPGPIDDAAIIWLGTYLFVELCPPEVVAEHMEALKKVVPGQWHDPLQAEDDVIEGEFREERP